MSDVKRSLEELMRLEGAVAVALVDWSSGMALGIAGGGSEFNAEVAAAGNTQVVRAKMQVIKNLQLNDTIEDILITLGKQYHLIRPLRSQPKLFLYISLNRTNANLAMARYILQQVEAKLII
ncbi:MAG: hypothetical protein MI924_33305 [Chloroflexales bacterium]|nr:hypothetical protein [Chloroflexales bacterium]